MKWNPQKQTLRVIESIDRKIAFKRFRSSSSAFISNKKVRDYVIDKHGKICYVCNTYLASQIDHVKSVYQCFKTQDYFYCNSIENLKPICSKCNQSKKP